MKEPFLFSQEMVKMVQAEIVKPGIKYKAYGYVDQGPGIQE